MRVQNQTESARKPLGFFWLGANIVCDKEETNDDWCIAPLAYKTTYNPSSWYLNVSKDDL